MSSIGDLSFELNSLSIGPRKKCVFLAIDTSYSMSFKFGGIKSRLAVAIDGACRVLDALHVGDMVVVVGFNNEIQLLSQDGLVEITGESTKTALKRCIRALKASGGTALYDSLMKGLKLVSDVSSTALVAGACLNEDFGSFWLCFLTDGSDEHSKTSLRDVKEILALLDVTVGSQLMKLMIIGVMLPQEGVRAMNEIKSAGGSMTTFVDAKNIDQVSSAFDEFVLQYTRASGIIAGAVQANNRSNNRLQLSAIQDTSTPRRGEIRPGSLVAVKDSVTTPRYQWGTYKIRGMHGLVVRVDADGDVYLQISADPYSTPTEGLWRGRLDELEVVDDGSFLNGRAGYHGHWDGKLQLGQAVRVPLTLTEPSTGWSTLQRGEVGYVRGFDKTNCYYVCDFPSCDGWKGTVHDLEVEAVATLIRPGEQVRRRRVNGGSTMMVYTNLSNNLATISSDTIGTVVQVQYDGICTVNFPGHPGCQARLDELETLNRPPTERAVQQRSGFLGSKNCAAGHGLQKIATLSANQKFCDFCGKMSGNSGTIMYNCAKCDVDACSDCFFCKKQDNKAFGSPRSSHAVPNVIHLSPSSSLSGKSNASNFSDTQSTTTSTTTTAQTFSDGSIITMKGFNTAAGAPFNGRTAKVLGFSSAGKYHVQCVGGEHEERMIAAKNMMLAERRYENGTYALLKNITNRLSLNGTKVVLRDFQPNTGRYQVESTRTGDFYNVLPENFSPQRIEDL